MLCLPKVYISDFHNLPLSDSSFPELAAGGVLGPLEQERDGLLAVLGVVGAVGLGVGVVPGGPAHLAHDLPEVGAHHLPALPQSVAAVDLGWLPVVPAEGAHLTLATSLTAAVAPAPRHTVTQSPSLHQIGIKLPEERVGWQGRRGGGLRNIESELV